MKALLSKAAGGPETLVLEDVDSPVAAPGWVVIKVKACGVNYPDALVIEDRYQFRPARPFAPGGEVSGVIKEVGEGVTHLAVGDRVLASFSSGGMVEEVAVEASRAVRIPDMMPFDEASAFLMTYGTSLYALKDRGHLQPGETLLVHAGAGGTGSAAIQVGCIAGARVIATAGSAERAKLCEDLGADVGIDSSSNDISQAVLTATDGRGADVIFDPVGGTVFDASRKCIASEGRLLVVGFAGGEIQQIPANQVLLRNYSVLGLYVGAYAHDEAGRALMQGVHGELMAMIAKGSFRPLVSGVISLDEVPSALEALRDRSVTGRVVVDLHQP